MSKNIIVIGAGASGLTAAITAARKGNKVTVLEHMDKPGKKLCLTGNGRCNLTNYAMGAEYYYGDCDFIKTVLGLFDTDATIKFLNSIGIYVHDRIGYVYPMSDQASSVLSLMIAEAKRLKVKLKYNQEVTDITAVEEGFVIHTPGYDYNADKVILATGGKSCPVTGSDGSGYTFLSSLGHSIETPLPALTSLICERNNFFNISKGVRIRSRLKLIIDKNEVKSSIGELQITEYGISGIMVFELSHPAVKALYENRAVSVTIYFLPDISDADLIDFISTFIRTDVSRNIQDALTGLINDNLARAVITAGKIDMKDTSENNICKIVALLKSYNLKVTGYQSFDRCQTTQGGADTREIDAYTMESRLVKGLYIAGEVMDVDGICGGYNLQWAFSTGAIAGGNV